MNDSDFILFLDVILHIINENEGKMKLEEVGLFSK